jgi:FMN phosphatase YigB (HAD superfamily)
VIIYTKEIVPKPSEKPFLVAIKKSRTRVNNAFYIADNPLIDFEGAKKIGMKTIRLKRGEFVKFPINKHIDLEIFDFRDLLNFFN